MGLLASPSEEITVQTLILWSKLTLSIEDKIYLLVKQLLLCYWLLVAAENLAMGH